MPGVVCKAIAVHTVSISVCVLVPLQESPRRIRAVDLEALIFAAMRLGQTHVVKHLPHIEQFGIELVPGARRPARRIDKLDLND